MRDEKCVSTAALPLYSKQGLIITPTLVSIQRAKQISVKVYDKLWISKNLKQKKKIAKKDGELTRYCSKMARLQYF